ncbi:E3 ubiquitin-protein ligase parkin-like [Bolinopsis microptera]|uniref:E3 ubiquitin-protein ligase parkin-like n=1 Tax=Bolinopsis microptera TaxID=2820187 RepID=UPI003079E69B
MDSDMHVFVKFNSSTVPITVNSSSTVHDIRTEISKTNNIRAGEVRIIFAGKELHDHQKLKDMDIQSQTVVHAFKGRHLEPRTPLHLQKVSSLGSDPSGKSSVPTYFVLCRRVCGAVKPGKLRIRCVGCREDKIVLTTEPQQWSDILEKGRIQGVCHTRGCSGAQPEFYFKCRGHEGQDHDHVVPLPHVRNNFLKVSCMTCLDEDSNPVIVFPCPSNHAMCISCFESYCLHQLNSRQFVEHETAGYTLSCPGFDSECRSAYVLDVHHFGIMGPENYERYKQFGAEECLLKMGGVLCPGTNCGMGIFLEDETEQTHHVECSECKLHFCVLCKEKYHGEELCTNSLGDMAASNSNVLSHYAVNMSLSKYDTESASTIRNTTKPCPQCGTPIEKSGGCMHMECPVARCKFSWCWICVTEWTPDCQDNHWFG